MGSDAFPVAVRPCLAVLGLAALALAMFPATPTGWVGVYMPLTISAALIAALLILSACLLPARSWHPPVALGRLTVAGVALALALKVAYLARSAPAGTVPWVNTVAGLVFAATAVAAALSRSGPQSLPTDLVGGLALFFSGEAVFCCRLNTPLEATEASLAHFEHAQGMVRLAAVAGLALTASLVLYRRQPAGRLRWLLCAQVLLVFAAGAVLRLQAVAADESPRIDLFFALQKGPKYLLEGINPYSAEYPWPGSPFYPPLPMLLCLPARAADLDARLVNAVCDLVAAGALLAAAWSRGRTLLGALLAAAYLHFPRVPLIMELAWYEPMLAALLGAGLLLARRGRWAGYVLLGLATTGKQYAPLLLPSLLRTSPGRRRLVLTTAGCVLVVVLPFFVWGPQAFLEATFFWHLGLAIRYDSVTLQAAAGNLFDLVLPRPVLLGTALALIGALVWRTPGTGRSPAPWLAATLLVFFLFHNQAFINYFYLCQYLMLFGLADWFAEDASLSVPRSPG